MKIKEFLRIGYKSLFSFLPRCKHKAGHKSALLFKLKHSALSPLLPIAKVSLKGSNEDFPEVSEVYIAKSGNQVCTVWK